MNFLFSGSEVFSAGVNIFRFVLVPTAVNSFAFFERMLGKAIILVIVLWEILVIVKKEIFYESLFTGRHLYVNRCQ